MWVLLVRPRTSILAHPNQCFFFLFGAKFGYFSTNKLGKKFENVFSSVNLTNFSPFFLVSPKFRCEENGGKKKKKKPLIRTVIKYSSQRGC
jgi:hypothetical protein